MGLPGVDRSIGILRQQLYRQLRTMVTGDEPAVRNLTDPYADEAGLFGPDSVTWRVHADGAMFVGGIRALFLQTMHPLAMAGVADHSDYRADPLARLATTARYLGVTTYGTTAQAEAAIAAVHRVHQRVVGTAPDGRFYSANDPHLRSWIHNALIDSFLRAYQRYGGARLTPEDADRYVAENAVLADRFGCDTAVESVAELRAWLRNIRPELVVGPQARTAVRFLVSPPLPIAARPAYAVLTGAAIGMLPAWVRRALWLPVPPLLEPFAVRPAAWTLTRTIDWAMRTPFDQPDLAAS
jgi:uncharacterized protein (DUF2236 family)